MKLEKIVLAFLLMLIAAYFCVIFFIPETNYAFYLKPFFIPVFCGYAILKNGFVFPKTYLLFVVLFYLGQLFMLFSDHSLLVLQLALVFYFMFYLTLISMSWSLIKNNQFIKIFTVDTIILILIIAFLLFVTVFIIFKSSTDAIINFISIFNAISALLLLITAVVYLSIATSKKSILYFFGSIFLIISDVFAALNIYYFGIFELNIIEIILHLVGFYLIYLFIIKKVKPDEISSHI